MSVRLLYFSWVRERIGRSEEEIQWEDETTVAGLVQRLAGLSAGHRSAFADPEHLRAAVNQRHCGFDAHVADGDEVAFFPPVTGG